MHGWSSESGLVLMKRAGLVAGVVSVLVLAGCSSGSSSGKTTITVWEGYTQTEAKAFTKLVNQFNESHASIHVNELETNNDYVLQKVLTAVRGGTPPDVAYLYGSWAPNVAKIPSVVDLTSLSKSPDIKWSDFWQAEQEAATVN